MLCPVLGAKDTVVTKVHPMPVFKELTVPANRREEMRLVLIPVKPLGFRVDLLLQHSIARLNDVPIV